jgi:hypothetical protein
MSINDAIEAVKEETELEHLVEVLGDDKAQEAAERHSLPEFVYGMNDGEASR